MPAIGPWELIIVLVIVVVIFGAGRLADVGGAIGKSVREFRGAVKSPEEQAAAEAHSTTPPPVASAPAAPIAASAPAAQTENKCPSCATVNPAGQVFCGQCGTRLTRAA
jgi:sec-independent protein translocase protein TatA